jgi:quercetin dioxygenase-like cupin family protein
MADVTVKRTEDFETALGGAMLKVRAGLEVSSFGMQLLRFPPNATEYPEHDHAGDQQEEVYTVLDGAATLIAGGEEHLLEPGVFARVGPSEPRKLTTGDAPALVLALGGIPGESFEAPGFTEAGGSDLPAEPA